MVAGGFVCFGENSQFFFFFFCEFVKFNELGIYFCDYSTIINTLLEENGVIDMVVCAHGKVKWFCRKYNMRILETYESDLASYRGNCAVVVTDQQMPREAYDSLKCSLFAKGVELVSTEWADDEVILRLLRNQIERRGRHGGRQPWGFRKYKGRVVEIPETIAIARRIISLRDSGKTYREIREDPRVRRLDGGELSLSTIQVIIKNRERYE